MVTEVFDLNLPATCPPEDATARTQSAYRLVKSDPPTQDDLLTHQELGLAPKANPCRRASISIFQSREQANHRLEMSPHLGSHIAFAELNAGHGQISRAQPQSGHMDWWPYQGMRRPEDFKVVE